jgi:hypothetical protein
MPLDKKTTSSQLNRKESLKISQRRAMEGPLSLHGGSPIKKRCYETDCLEILYKFGRMLMLHFTNAHGFLFLFWNKGLIFQGDNINTTPSSGQNNLARTEGIRNEGIGPKYLTKPTAKSNNQTTYQFVKAHGFGLRSLAQINNNIPDEHLHFLSRPEFFIETPCVAIELNNPKNRSLYNGPEGSSFL